MLVRDLAKELQIDKSSLRKWIIKHFGKDILVKVRAEGSASDMLAILPEHAEKVRKARIEWIGIVDALARKAVSQSEPCVPPAFERNRDLLLAFNSFLHDRRRMFFDIANDEDEATMSRYSASDVADEYTCMIVEFKHKVFREFFRHADGGI